MIESYFSACFWQNQTTNSTGITGAKNFFKQWHNSGIWAKLYHSQENHSTLEQVHMHE